MGHWEAPLRNNGALRSSPPQRWWVTETNASDVSWHPHNDTNKNEHQWWWVTETNASDVSWPPHNNTNKIIVKDIDGNKLKVDREDPRYVSGELVPWNKGISQNKVSNEKRSIALKGIQHERYVCECGASVAKQSSAINRHNTSFAHAHNMTGISIREWQQNRSL